MYICVFSFHFDLSTAVAVCPHKALLVSILPRSASLLSFKPCLYFHVPCGSCFGFDTLSCSLTWFSLLHVASDSVFIPGSVLYCLPVWYLHMSICNPHLVLAVLCFPSYIPLSLCLFCWSAMVFTLVPVMFYPVFPCGSSHVFPLFISSVIPAINPAMCLS